MNLSNFVSSIVEYSIFSIIKLIYIPGTSVIDCIPFISLIFGIKNPLCDFCDENGKPKNLTGYNVVVTGSNTGVGKQTAIQLVKMGANVILACRSSSRAEEAMNDIKREQRDVLCACKGTSFISKYYNKVYPYCSYGTVQYAHLDLSDLVSIKSFVPLELIEKLQVSRIDILVNNAGLNSRGVTKHGLQQLFQVNYLGHYLLFQECLPLLQKQALIESSKETSIEKLKTNGNSFQNDQTMSNLPDHGRVVNLSSICHHFGTNAFQYSATTNKCPFHTIHHYYDDSKYYMNLFTLEINRRYSGVTSVRCNATDSNEYKYEVSREKNINRPIVAVSVNPGAVRSDIWRSVPRFIMYFYDVVMRCLFLNVSQGAGTSIYACYAPLAILNREIINSYSKAIKLVENPGTSYLTTHPFIPYLVPYFMWTSERSFKNTPAVLLNLLCEGFGVYVGPQWSTLTLKAHADETAFQLWEYSKDMCDGICASS